MLRALAARALHAVALGRVTVVDDTGAIQKLQVTEAPGPDGSPGIVDNVGRVSEFGFASSPPLQSDVLVVRLWGNRTLTIAIGTNHQPSRLKNLQPGDSAIYDVRQAKILLGPTGIVIDGAGLPLTIQNVGGKIAAPGAVLTCQNVVTASGVDLAGHVHTQVNAGTGVSGPPQG